MRVREFMKRNMDILGAAALLGLAGIGAIIIGLLNDSENDISEDEAEERSLTDDLLKHLPHKESWVEEDEYGDDYYITRHYGDDGEEMFEIEQIPDEDEE